MTDRSSSRIEFQHDGRLGVKVSKAFSAPVGRIFDHFELSAYEGEILAILGPSGSGKTTLLDLIAGLQYPDGGASCLVGSRCGLAYAFQTPRLIPWRRASGNAVFEVDIRERDRQSAMPLISHLLQMFCLPSVGELYPHQLSAGMQQRLQLARAISWGPRVLLLDEPLGAVDQPLRLKIAKDLREHLKSNSVTTIWVTHDSLESVVVSDRVVVFGGRPAEIVHEHVVQRGKDQASILRTDDGTLETQAAALREQIPLLPTDADIVKEKPSSSNTSLRLRLRRLVRIFLPLLFMAFIFVVWEMVVMIRPGLQFYISAPMSWIPLAISEITEGRLIADTTATLARAGIGFAIAMVGGAVIGALAGASSIARDSIRPVLVGLTAVPLFVLAPMFILWFGVGDKMKIAVAALSSLPFVAYLVLDASVASRDRFYHYLRNTGARPLALTRFLVAPAAGAAMIYAIRPASIIALIGAFLGEFIAAENGLGYYIVLNASRYNADHVVAGVSMLFASAMCIDFAANALRRAIPGVAGAIPLNMG